MQTINRISEKEFYKKDIENFINFEKHPCIVGSSIIEQGNYEFDLFEQFADKESSELMCEQLYNFLDKVENSSDNLLFSYMAIFRTPGYLSEMDFEEMLWKHLQYAHEYDCKKFGWDVKVNSDPNDPNFSFSLGGNAFYVIGLHPMSSRKARRFDHVALVFNLHAQFDRLKRQNVYSKVQKKVRGKDQHMNGSFNPMLSDFGKSSEAIQYSGREVKVKEEWKCPFHAAKANAVVE